MKKLILFAAIVAFFAQAKAQVIDVKTVPPVVVTNFQTAYPSVSGVQWRQDGTYYVADYSNANTPMYVTYDPSGNVIETGESVAVSAYPPAMTTYVKEKYKGDEFKNVYRVKDASGKTIWKGKIKGDDVYFDENGNFVRTDGKDKTKIKVTEKDDKTKVKIK